MPYIYALKQNNRQPKTAPNSSSSFRAWRRLIFFLIYDSVRACWECSLRQLCSLLVSFPSSFITTTEVRSIENFGNGPTSRWTIKKMPTLLPKKDLFEKPVYIIWSEIKVRASRIRLHYLEHVILDPEQHSHVFYRFLRVELHRLCMFNAVFAITSKSPILYC